MPQLHCLKCGTPLVERLDSGLTRAACPAPSCGWVFYDNPLPVVAALVEHPQGVILARQQSWPETWFGLITGFIERGESAEAAAVREVKEELSLDARVESLIGVFPFEVKNELIVAYHLKAEGEVRLSEELASFKFVPPDRLKPWPFATGLAVEAWLARRTPSPR